MVAVWVSGAHAHLLRHLDVRRVRLDKHVAQCLATPAHHSPQSLELIQLRRAYGMLLASSVCLECFLLVSTCSGLSLVGQLCVPAARQ